MSESQQHPADDESATTEKRRRGRPRLDRAGSESVKRQRTQPDSDTKCLSIITEEDQNVSVALSPKPKRRAKFITGQSDQNAATDDASISAESGQDILNRGPLSLQNIISELSNPDLLSEKRDTILETLLSGRFLGKYSDRALLIKKLVHNQIDYDLLNLQPVPKSVSVFFQRLFTSIHRTTPSKAKTLDLLFEQINECLSEDNGQVAELTKVLSSNESSISSLGGYMVMMLRLAALRQLESNGFDAFDTLCYLIEILRQCVSKGVASTVNLMADEKSFLNFEKKTEASQVQLAFSMSKYGLSLPKTPS